MTRALFLCMRRMCRICDQRPAKYFRRHFSTPKSDAHHDTCLQCWESLWQATTNGGVNETRMREFAAWMLETYGDVA